MRRTEQREESAGQERIAKDTIRVEGERDGGKEQQSKRGEGPR